MRVAIVSKKISFLGALLLFAIVLIPHSAYAANKSPQPDTSFDPVLGHVVSKANYVNVPHNNLVIYAAQPDIVVAVVGADMCDSEMLGGTNDYVDAGLDGVSGGSPVSRFNVTGSAYKDGKLRRSGCVALAGGQQEMRTGQPITGSSVVASTLILEGHSSATKNTVEGVLYKFDFHAQWDAAGACDPTRAACGVNGFRIQVLNKNGSNFGSADNVYISQAGGRANEFGINVGRVPRAPSPYFSNYDARFGTDCSITSGMHTESVYIYDDDNYDNNAAQDVNKHFGVKLQKTNATNPSPVDVPFTSVSADAAIGVMNDPGGSGYRLIGTHGSGHTVEIKFSAEPLTKYTFKIRDIDQNNVIQYQLPFDSLWADRTPKCDWDLQPKTDISDTVRSPGQTATWWHDIENTGEVDAPRGINWQVEQTISGTPGFTTPASGVTSAVIQPGLDNQLRVAQLNYNVTAADIGKTICQRLAINPYSTDSKRTNPSAKRYSAYKCFTVTAPPDQKVTITPWAYPVSGDVEPDVPATFNGGATVSGFPSRTQWGYTEKSALGTSRRVQPTFRGPVDTSTESTGASGYNTYCSNGGSPSNGCFIAGYDTCYWSPGSSSKCGKDYATYHVPDSYGYTFNYYYCPASHPYGGGYSSTCYRYVYRCTETGGGYSPTYPSGCRTYIGCEGAYPEGWHTTIPNGSQCMRWYCGYSDSPQYNQNEDPNLTQCEYRCQSGSAPEPGTPENPGRAPEATGSRYDSGDTNCYRRPSFTITCQWQDVSRNYIGTPTNATVNSNGSSYCPASITRTGSLIGQKLCVFYSAKLASGWTSPPPGYQLNRQVLTWGFDFVPMSTPACVNIVGKPYLRVVGGDAATGSAAAATSSLCSSNSGASIKAHNRGTLPFAGAGASVATLATGSISGFPSGQFANIVLGTAPTALSFANTTGGMGGGWGSTVPCVGIDKFKESIPLPGDELTGRTVPAVNTQCYLGSGTQGSCPVGYHQVTTQQWRYTHDGDIFISGDIKYSGGTWGNVSDIPLFQIVVNGDIYIDNDITQLDGVFISVGGTIYTCSTAIGDKHTDTWQGDGSVCGKQLVVNGAFIADNIRFSRECATLNRSQPFETTNYTGGTDPQYCQPAGSGTRASEVFNFLPEQWIKSSIGPPGTKYDAITNMPPIL